MREGREGKGKREVRRGGNREPEGIHEHHWWFKYLGPLLNVKLEFAGVSG